MAGPGEPLWYSVIRVKDTQRTLVPEALWGVDASSFPRVVMVELGLHLSAREGIGT